MRILFMVSEFGFWAEECVEPLKTIREEHEVEIATPTGDQPEADPESLEGYRDFLKGNDKLNNPVNFMEAYRNRDEYDALVLPGGHGTLWDVNQDSHVQEILKEKIDDSAALVICHAVGILGFTPEITDGREVTGFPNEWENQQVNEDEIRKGGKLPYRVEKLVKKAGANWDAELESEISVKKDGGLITARGPDSSKKGAEVFLEALD